MKAIFIVALIFFVGHTPIKPDRQGNHPDSGSNGEGVASIVVVNNQAASSQESNSDKKAPSGNAAVWANWALVGIGLITFLAVWKQARESAKATQAMRDSIPHQEKAANSAKDSADALINSERPWIVVNIKKTEASNGGVWNVLGDELPPQQAFEEYHSFELVAKNLGRTPAEIFAVIGIHEVSKKGFDGGFDANAEPDYGEPTKLQYVKLLAPNEDWTCYFIMTSGHYTKEELDGFVASRLHLIFRGVVKYRDQFRPKETHETRFCYTYRVKPKDFSPSGPYHYTAYT